jgi:hypothetical protein
MGLAVELIDLHCLVEVAGLAVPPRLVEEVALADSSAVWRRLDRLAPNALWRRLDWLAPNALWRRMDWLALCHT